MEKPENQNTPKKEEALCMEYLEAMDNLRPAAKVLPIICCIMMRHPNIKIAAAAREHLLKWVMDCKAYEGMKELEFYNPNAVPVLDFLSLSVFVLQD